MDMSSNQYNMMHADDIEEQRLMNEQKLLMNEQKLLQRAKRQRVQGTFLLTYDFLWLIL